MHELNTMLAELAGDGALESTGVFTLSPEKAMEKLAAFRLVSPGLFVLNLVAAAVSANATRFNIETRGESTRFDFDPKLEPSEGQLQGLFALILDPAAPPFLRELALAVHGAGSLPRQPSVRLFVTTSQLSRELVIRDGNIDITPAPPGPPGLTFQLDYPEQSGWSSLFSRKSDPQTEVVKHVFHFCRFAPLTITNNGKSEGSPVTGSASDSSVFAWRHLTGTQALRAVPATRRTDLLISGKRTSPTASSMLLTLRSGLSSAGEGFLLISRGVVFKRPISELGFPLARAVVTADHLEKNLSQSDLVQGPEYDILIKTIQTEIDELILEVCSNPPRGWSMDIRTVFLTALASRYSKTAEPPQVETFRRLDGMRTLCATDSGQESQLEYWRQLSTAGDATAKSFGKELKTAIQAILTRRFAAEDWAGAVGCLARLRELGAPPDPALLAALQFLSGDNEGVQASLASGGLDHHLTLLLGGSPAGNSTDPLSKLLLMQQAVDKGDLTTADQLAEELKEQDGTPMLFLWLGWYSRFRGQMTQACRLWDNAVRLVGGEEGQVWATELWGELAGKVSFLEQVRWQARRRMEELFSPFLSTRRAYGVPTTMRAHPTLWASRVWKTRTSRGDERARHLFVTGYLKSLIDLHELRLLPPRACHGPLAFFRST